MAIDLEGNRYGIAMAWHRHALQLLFAFMSSNLCGVCPSPIEEPRATIQRRSMRAAQDYVGCSSLCLACTGYALSCRPRRVHKRWAMADTASMHHACHPEKGCARPALHYIMQAGHVHKRRSTADSASVHPTRFRCELRSTALALSCRLGARTSGGRLRTLPQCTTHATCCALRRWRSSWRTVPMRCSASPAPRQELRCLSVWTGSTKRLL